MRNDVAIYTLKWVSECRAKYGWDFLPPADQDSTARFLLQEILLQAGWADQDVPHTKAANIGFTEAGLSLIAECVQTRYLQSWSADPEDKAGAWATQRGQLLHEAKKRLVYTPKAPKSEFEPGKERIPVGGRRLGKSKTSELAKIMAGFGDSPETLKPESKFTGTAVTGIIFDEITEEPEMIALDAKTKLPIVDTSLPDDAEFLNVDSLLMEKFERKSEVIESFVENKDLKLWGTW